MPDSRLWRWMLYGYPFWSSLLRKVSCHLPISIWAILSRSHNCRKFKSYAIKAWTTCSVSIVLDVLVCAFFTFSSRTRMSQNLLFRSRRSNSLIIVIFDLLPGIIVIYQVLIMRSLSVDDEEAQAETSDFEEVSTPRIQEKIENTTRHQVESNRNWLERILIRKSRKSNWILFIPASCSWRSMRSIQMTKLWHKTRWLIAFRYKWMKQEQMCRHKLKMHAK